MELSSKATIVVNEKVNQDLSRPETLAVFLHYFFGQMVLFHIKSPDSESR